MKPLKKVVIADSKIADYRIEKNGKINTLKRNAYCVVDGYSIRGDAPKSFIKVYEYQCLGKPKKAQRVSRKQRKTNTNTWTLYIAKTGNKWYPIESITEHLIARIGEVVGLNMAFSRLTKMDDQIRFLSKYFIDHKSQELVHGTDILAAYFDDRTFVEEIQLKKLEPEFFTLETVIESIQYMFPNNHSEIIEKYFLMLVFDAWVGVQDRHFENWGVVRSIFEKRAPYFSPIYDSARGLFWNEKEEKVRSWHSQNMVDFQIEKQIRNSRPQIGLKAGEKTSHLSLIEEILTDRFLPIKAKVREIFTADAIAKVQDMIAKEFSGILSEIRINMIINCLNIRYSKLKNFL